MNGGVRESLWLLKECFMLPSLKDGVLDAGALLIDGLGGAAAD